MRRAYVVFSACFFGETFIFGLAYSLGLFYTLFLEPFPDGAIAVAWSVTLNVFCIFMSSPLCSFLNGCIGTCWTMVIGCCLSTIGLLATAIFANSPLALCLTYGLVTGCGWGIGFSVTLKTLIGEHFSQFRKFAFCAAGCGCGLGTFIFPPMVELLEREYGWRGVMLLIAAANLNLIPVSLVARSPIRKKKPVLNQFECPIVKGSARLHEDSLIDKSLIQTHEEESKCSVILQLDEKQPEKEALKPPDCQKCATQNKTTCGYYTLILHILRDFRFVLFSLNVFLVSMTASLVNTHLPGFALNIKVTGSLGATFLLSIIGIAFMIGRLICGFVAMRFSVVRIYFLATLCLGFLTIPAVFFDTYIALVCFSILFGFFYSTSCLLPELVVFLRGLEQLNSCYAIIEIMRGSGMLLGGPLGGAFVEQTGTFTAAFVTAGLLGLFGSLGMTVSLCYQNKGIELEGEASKL